MKSVMVAALVASLVSGAVAASEPLISGEPCVATEAHGLKPRDLDRIETLTSSRTIALAEALGSENSDERAYIASIYEGGLARLDTIETGKYHCRTIKMGKGIPIIIYQWFSCEVGQEDAATTLRKVTGSQNFFGLLSPAGHGLLYRGALNYGYEDELTYYGEKEERDQVGCLLKDYTDGDRYILELPSPYFESQHDIIELRRSGG